MVAAANMVEVAALVGDTARATMLAALMGGQSLTGSELAYLARVSRLNRQRTSHQARQRAASQRHQETAVSLLPDRFTAGCRMLESIKAVAAIELPPRYQPRSAQDEALRFARTCYDHLAGQLGVAIADALVAKGYVVLG